LCASDKMLYLFTTKDISLSYINFSDVLEKLDNLDIGLQFRGHSTPFLNEGPTNAIFILYGKVPY